MRKRKPNPRAVKLLSKWSDQAKLPPEVMVELLVLFVDERLPGLDFSQAMKQGEANAS